MGGMDHWTQILIVFFTTLPATIAAVGALISSIRNTKKINENTEITKGAIVETKDKVDSALKKSADEARIEAAAAAKAVAARAVIAAKEVADATAKQAADAVKQTTEAVQTLTTAVNGRMDQLLKEARDKAFAEGYLKGQQEAKKGP